MKLLPSRCLVLLCLPGLLLPMGLQICVCSWEGENEGRCEVEVTCCCGGPEDLSDEQAPSEPCECCLDLWVISRADDEKTAGPVQRETTLTSAFAGATPLLARAPAPHEVAAIAPEGGGVPAAISRVPAPLRL